MVMAQTVNFRSALLWLSEILSGKTFDFGAPEWPDGAGVICRVRQGNQMEAFTGISGHRRPRRNRRQNPTPGVDPRRKVPAAAADRSRHPRRTLVNHGFAGAVGSWITFARAGDILRWVLGISFLAMAGWTLIPGRFDEDDAKLARLGVFGTTLVAFFLAKWGRQDPGRHVALAAQYQSLFYVVTGTTLGMMIANVPAVIMGIGSPEKCPSVVPGLQRDLCRARRGDPVGRRQWSMGFERTVRQGGGEGWPSGRMSLHADSCPRNRHRSWFHRALARREVIAGCCRTALQLETLLPQAAEHCANG